MRRFRMRAGMPLTPVTSTTILTVRRPSIQPFQALLSMGPTMDIRFLGDIAEATILTDVALITPATVAAIATVTGAATTAGIGAVILPCAGIMDIAADLALQLVTVQAATLITVTPAGMGMADLRSVFAAMLAAASPEVAVDIANYLTWSFGY